MYAPTISTRHRLFKLAAVGLCSISGLTSFVFHADAQTVPHQPQAVGAAAASTPNPAANWTPGAQPGATGATPSAPSTPLSTPVSGPGVNTPPTADPQTPAGTESALYNWDNTQGIHWNTAVKSEQQVIAEFQGKVKQAILNACTYPHLRAKQADKIVELAIQIDSDGTIGNIDVNNSSGHKQFDAALMLAAKKISEPLKPPHGRSITLLIVFKNSELGQIAPAQEPAADHLSMTPPSAAPVMQAAPANK